MYFAQFIEKCKMKNIDFVESLCETACVRIIFHYVGIEYKGDGTTKQAKA